MRGAYARVGRRPPRFLQRPTDIHRLAESRYRARPYDGEIVVICAGPAHNQKGWEQVAAGGARIVELPGPGDDKTEAHLTDALHLPVLTEALGELLDEV